MPTDEPDKLQGEWVDKPCDHPDIITDRETEPAGDDKWLCANAVASRISMNGEDRVVVH